MKHAHPARAADTGPYVVALEFASRATNELVPLTPGVHTLGSSSHADVVLRGPGALADHGVLVVGEAGECGFHGRHGGRASVHTRSISAGRLSCGDVVHLGEEVVVVHALDSTEQAFAPAVPGLRGQSAPMRRLARMVATYRPLDIPVLIHGPSGTGKDAVALALHGRPTASKPFVVANVAAFSRTLCESELFGHTRGAFTGADRDHAGLLEQADGGTLFLDEIGELPADVQPKLLRALDGYGFRPIGARGAVHPHVRVVTASHVDLRQAVDRGTFRNDLLHRLEVLVIETAPLALRRTDIAAIACGIVAAESGRMRPQVISPAGIALLMELAWPGNVRELRNVLLRAAALATRHAIEVEDLQRALGRAPRSRTADVAFDVLLAASEGNITRAAYAAKIPRTTFRRRLREWKRVQDADARGAAAGPWADSKVSRETEHLLAAE